MTTLSPRAREAAVEIAKAKCGNPMIRLPSESLGIMETIIQSAMDDAQADLQDALVKIVGWREIGHAVTLRERLQAVEDIARDALPPHPNPEPEDE